MAVFSPGALAQDISRGGSLKCSNSLASDVSATATLVWTQGGSAINGGQIFSCDATKQQDDQLVLQPASADGWTLDISLTAGFGTFSCNPDVGSFSPGDMPHIRLRCVSPTGGSVTFSLSRKP